MYCTIGYPLGYYFNENKQPISLLELSDRTIEMTPSETLVWSSSDVREANSDRAQVEIEELRAKNVLIQAETFADLFDKLRFFKVVRQGIAMLKDSKHCIFAGDETFVSEWQIKIWRLANGTRTFLEIFLELDKETNHQLRLEEFAEDVFFLRNEWLILFQ